MNSEGPNTFRPNSSEKPLIQLPNLPQQFNLTTSLLSNNEPNMK